MPYKYIKILSKVCSSAKICSSVSVLTLVHSRFELILRLDSASVEVQRLNWASNISTFVARCFLLSFIFSYLILHRLIWGIKFFLGFSYWTRYVNLKPTANAGKRDAIKTYVDIALYTIDSTPWGSPTAINTAFSSGQWSSNFFYYFLPVSALFFLPLPTSVYFSPKIFFFLPRALPNMNFYS